MKTFLVLMLMSVTFDGCKNYDSKEDVCIDSDCDTKILNIIEFPDTSYKAEIDANGFHIIYYDIKKLKDKYSWFTLTMYADCDAPKPEFLYNGEPYVKSSLLSNTYILTDKCRGMEVINMNFYDPTDYRTMNYDFKMKDCDTMVYMRDHSGKLFQYGEHVALMSDGEHSNKYYRRPEKNRLGCKFIVGPFYRFEIERQDTINYWLLTSWDGYQERKDKYSIIFRPKK
jgi:hypothetical protein